MFLTLTCDSYGKVARRRHPGRPGQLRLPAGRPRRDPLRGAVRPAHPEPAPLPRLRRPVLRRHRTPETPRPARAHRVPRRHLPRRPAPGHRRHLPPGLVALHRHRALRRRRSCPSGTRPPAATSTRPPAKLLPTWDQALDAIGPHDQPLHVARFGPKFDAQGVLAGTRDAARCIGYLTKYLTKQIAGCHSADTDAQADHADRLTDALRYEPCSPACANWLRYGIQPQQPPARPRPGQCKGKAHRSEHLGYAGRRVLVSRKWSGKTLADHRADRKAWLTGHARSSGNRPRPLHLGTRHPRRPRPHAARPGGSCTSWPTAPDGASRPDRGQTKSRRGHPRGLSAAGRGGVMGKPPELRSSGC